MHDRQDTDQAVAIHHRQLREARVAQSIVRGGQHVVRADRDRRALTVRATDEVAQIAVALAMDETLILHPEIVEELGQISSARVARQRDDSFRIPLLTAIT